MYIKFLKIILFSACSILLLACASAVPELKLAREAWNRGENEIAYEYYSRVLKKEPRNDEAREKLNELNEVLAGQLQLELENQVKDLDQITVPDLQEILKRLGEARKFDPDRTAFAEIRTIVRRQIGVIEKENQKRAIYASQALRVSNTALALKYFGEIYKRDPKADVLPELEKAIMGLYNRQFEHKLSVYLKNGKIKEIPQEMENLRKLGVSEASVAKLGKIFDDFSNLTMRGYIQQKMDKNRYYSAYIIILESKREKIFSELVTRIKNSGAVYYLAQAQALYNQKKYHRSFLEALKGMRLNSEYPGLFEAHRVSRDKVLEGLNQYIAISAFGAPKKDPDLGPQFSDALISYLYKTLPYGVKVLEREKVDLVMREERREFSKVSRRLNVDWIVTGNVSLMEIDRQESIRTGVVRAKVGEKQIPGQGEDSAREAVYDNVEYRKGRVRLKSYAAVLARIFDTSKGAVTYAQELNARYSIEDQFQDGVDGTVVVEDPLELPTDTEIHEILRSQILKQLTGVIQVEFAKQGTDFLQRLRFYLSRKEVSKAMKPLAEGFLYAKKSNLPDDDPMVQELRNQIINHTE